MTRRDASALVPPSLHPPAFGVLGAPRALSWLLLVVLLSAAAPAAGDVVLLYDDVGRLARVIRADGEAATFHYDLTGNITRITRESGAAQTTTVSSTSTTTGSQGSRITLTITGTNLLGASLVSLTLGIVAEEIVSTLDSLTITLFIAARASPGSASLEVRGGGGTVAIPFTVTLNSAILTVAGNGSQGFTGDGVPATTTRLSSPWGVTVDGSGNFFIADTFNRRVRKVAPDGVITTVAGTGIVGFDGDGGPATSAQLENPWSVALNGQGALFISDSGTVVSPPNNRIRRVAPDGTISTAVGTGEEGFSGDGGPADAARLSYPTGLAFDGQGNLFIADRDNHRIRRVASDGTISTVAGDGTGGFGGDGGPALAAQLNSPTGVAVDAQGQLFIADHDNHRVRMIASDGTITTVAGDGAAGFGGDGGPATAAQLHDPAGVAVNSLGTIFIADSDNNRIRKVTAAGIISTVAGTGTAGFSGDGGPGAAAELNYPTGVAIDAQGSLYIADTSNHRIRKIGPGGL